MSISTTESLQSVRMQDQVWQQTDEANARDEHRERIINRVTSGIRELHGLDEKEVSTILSVLYVKMKEAGFSQPELDAVLDVFTAIE